MQIAILGIDLGKNSCSLAACDATGQVILPRRMKREGIITFVSNLPACVIAMEACGGAHHLGRLFQQNGHEVRLMSPDYVRPYVKAQKNDDRDAEAIAEAAPPSLNTQQSYLNYMTAPCPTYCMLDDRLMNQAAQKVRPSIRQPNGADGRRRRSRAEQHHHPRPGRACHVT